MPRVDVVSRFRYIGPIIALEEIRRHKRPITVDVQCVMAVERGMLDAL